MDFRGPETLVEEVGEGNVAKVEDIPAYPWDPPRGMRTP